jgi:aminopeptidase
MTDTRDRGNAGPYGLPALPGYDMERLAAVARTIVRDCGHVQPGENVYIEGRADAMSYLELLALECELVGARPLVIAPSDELRRARLLELSEGQLATMNAGWIEAARQADIVFTVRMEDGKPELFRGIPEAKFGANLRGRKLLADVIYDGSRRWIGTDLPTPWQAEAFGLDFASFNDMFWRSLLLDYRELSRRADVVAAVLEGADTVRITSPKGTDVAMRITGRPLDKDIGVVTPQAPLSNLPAGEVCLAPLEDSAEGRVVFDLAFWNGVRIEDLEVLFERGVCRPVCARSGFETFAGVLDNATGAGNVIGELGIGLNPEVGEPCGYMLTDEKILGTIHIAVGDNGMLGGVNDSSLHWDLLVMEPTVTVDGRPLMIEGRLAV